MLVDEVVQDFSRRRRALSVRVGEDVSERLTKPMWENLHEWLRLERRRVADGGATAKAIDYSLNCWTALTRHLQDGAVGLDNNFLERQIKPWQMGRRAWLFAGSELAGQRAAVVMSLVQSARMNGHDPWQYLRYVLARTPTHLNSRMEELLPHRWRAAGQRFTCPLIALAKAE
jgi:transposase